MGMDGGNIHSDIWFCGIEFGATYEQMVFYYPKYVKFSKVKNLKIPYRDDCPDKFMKSPYDRFLSAMYIKLFKKEGESNKVKTELIETVLKNELYNKDSNIFKLNLFPKSKEEQKQIVKKLDKLSAKTKKLELIYQQKLEDLEELKKSVLQKAFN